MSIKPGVIALAESLKDALELPEGHTGQAMLNFSDGKLQSVETRSFQRVQSFKVVDKTPAVRANLTQ